jgi:hypothetical protein
VSQALGAAAEGVATQEALERMERNYQDLVTETEGRMSVDALLALVDSLGTLPGRKTVVYLCEGMTIPPSVEPRFRSSVDTANRRNVSLYAMDAAGLRVSQRAGRDEESARRHHQGDRCRHRPPQ